MSAPQLFQLLSRLKTTPRTGWVHHGVKNPESIADHMYRLAMLCLMFPDPNLNHELMLHIALVHDIGESITGDFTPSDPISKEEKRQLETEAIDRIQHLLTEMNPHLSLSVKELWLDYEYQRNQEAMLVKQMDKFEMLLQADEYEQQQGGMDLEEFFQTSTTAKITHPILVSWLNDLQDRRSERKQQQQPQEE
jgi:putative hydrolases of HD superfamily